MKKETVVICHNIRSAHNVGAFLRTADGAGIKKVFLTGYTPSPPNPKIQKTSLVAERFVAWMKRPKISVLIRELRADGYRIVTVERTGMSTDFGKFNPPEKVCYIFGNEVREIHPGILKQCDRIIEIPMLGKKESLNVSVAFGIIAYRYM